MLLAPGKKHMDINPESRERILNAAHQLFEQSGRKDLPTVDAVRRVSKTSMNDASAVMKEWRRMQIVTASATVVSVPDRVQQAGQSAISTLWTEAQELANDALNVAQAAWDAERSEAEKLRVELSSAFETQGAELEALRVKLAEVEKQAAATGSRANGPGAYSDGTSPGDREAGRGPENGVEFGAVLGGKPNGGSRSGAQTAWGRASARGGLDHGACDSQGAGGSASKCADRPGRPVET